MPFLTRGDAKIYYEEYGSGYPILCFAPGSLGSSIEHWHQTAPFDPTVVLAPDYRIIVMDQRNAGQSWAPIRASDGWDTYTADHVALADHLGIEKCHVLGQCIGAGGFPFGFMRTQPGRVSCAVLMQPSGRIGPDQNRPGGGFHRWRADIKDHPEATPEVFDSFYNNLYRNDFVYSTPREFVPTCQVPMLIMAGNDEAHPFELAVEISKLAPNNEFIPEWKSGEPLKAAIQRIQEFLGEHTPQQVAAGGR
jgi:pimeloyl-ACP methyl ester carboxylesterase